MAQFEDATPRAMASSVPDDKQNPALYMVLVVGLVLTALITVAGGVVLAYFDKVLPAELIALAGAAVGFLGGLLVPSPRA